MSRILITAGDPNGVGPEIILKTLADSVYSKVVVFGDANHFDACAHELNIKNPLKVIEPGFDLPSSDDPCLYPIESGAPRRPGVADPVHAQQVIKVLTTATRLCLDGHAGAMVTAPINKAVLKDGAQFAFPGHTELLASLSGIKTPVMMLVAPDLRTVPVTIHIPLSDVPSRLTPSLLKETINTTHVALRKNFHIENPRIVVAGLNPHAGEEGKIGTEEQDWMAQTIFDLAASGLAISGPYPADTLFHEARRKDYDAAICMYHDQALIPVKTLAFDDGVNATLGLPFIRTSPDHGTAFDIAGKGIARPDSFKAALELAQTLVETNV